MDAGLIAALLLAAVLGFWLVGAYNRLQRLRNAAAQAYARFDALWAERLAAAQRLCEAATQRNGERSAVELARAALRQAGAAADAARARPLLRRTMLPVAMSAQVLQVALDALRLREAGRSFAAPAVAPADAGDSPAAAEAAATADSPASQAAEPAAPAGATWDDACAALDTQAAAVALARADYDACAASYNDAAAQFPTRLVALLFSLGPACALDPHLSAESTLEAATPAP